jgi:pyrroline-5-carboxylate reductase
MTKIGFIGFGKMASALWEGFSRAKTVQEACFNTRTADTQTHIALKYGIPHVSIETLVEKCNLIFICVKPQQVNQLLRTFPKLNPNHNQVIISILAGVPIQTFEHYLGPNIACIRAMPNTPAQLGEGITALCKNSQVSPPMLALVQTLFHSCGKTITIQEAQFNIVTSISGSGPAFFYKIAQDSQELATQLGLSEQASALLISQTLIGAGKMLQESLKTPQELIQEVSSPNGTTVAGLATYDQNRVGERWQAIITAAYNRASQLEQENTHAY